MTHSLPPPTVPPAPVASAMRRAIRKGYGWLELRHDVLAGLVVGVVALPLSMALAIAVGAPPQHGLFTAIIGGLVIAPLGGSKFQVSGPTAAFVVILAPILTEHGLSGLLTAGFLAGLVLIALGAFRWGNLIRFVPYPVTTGFTAGIAVVIGTLQIADALGLKVEHMPEAWHEKVLAMWAARGTASLPEAGLTALTLFILVIVAPRIRNVPGPLLAVIAATLTAAALARWADIHVATIGTRFAPAGGGLAIPRTLPWPSAPWGDHFTFGLVRELFPSAIVIALLGAIESLLSAVVSDAATGTRHDPDAELVAQGIGNVVAPFFGGIAATGALARTATNIRAGARSPVAAMVHGVVILLSMLVLAPLVAWIPMASLAGLLLVVAWNMSERHAFGGLLRRAPRSDVAVLVTCFLLTILFDMTVAVTVGFLLAAVLFLRRMSDITGAGFVTALDATEDEDRRPLPDGVALYEVNGPLFFGAAQKAMDRLSGGPGLPHRVLVLHLGRVPVIDATGLVALENVCRQLVHAGKRVVIAGPLPAPRDVWARADLTGRYPGVTIALSVEDALSDAAAIAAQTASTRRGRTPAPKA